MPRRYDAPMFKQSWATATVLKKAGRAATVAMIEEKRILIVLLKVFFVSVNREVFGERCWCRLVRLVLYLVLRTSDGCTQFHYR